MSGERTPSVLQSVPVQEQARTLQRPVNRFAAADASREEAVRRQGEAAQAQQLEKIQREAYDAGLEAGKRQAFEEGRLAGAKQGESAGRAAALAEYSQRIERLDAVLAELTDEVPRRLEACEEDVVALAFAAVCKIVGRAAITPKGARGAVLAALDQLRTRPLVALRVHPNDLALLRGDDRIADMIALHGAAQGLEWRADERVKLGGCVLETAGGTLDARLETQLDSLRASLVKARASVAPTDSTPDGAR
jgi:flagellar assembly protein FliH